jgi:hypothetical protein
MFFFWRRGGQKVTNSKKQFLRSQQKNQTMLINDNFLLGRLHQKRFCFHHDHFCFQLTGKTEQIFFSFIKLKRQIRDNLFLLFKNKLIFSKEKHFIPQFADEIAFKTCMLK